MNNSTIAFIGAGNMARSLVGGLIADGYDPTYLRVTDPDLHQLQQLSQRFAVATSQDNGAAISGQIAAGSPPADVVVLAVKPQIIRSVAKQIASEIAQHKPLVITIAAGIREPDLRRWLGGAGAIVRTMPNTPALVQSGATALFANPEVSVAQRDLAESILRAVGLTIWLDNESQMDAVTALSGSGPAYFLLVMEALQQAGVQLGLPTDTARLLALQTAFGAAKMALESAEEPATLRARVTSPGGTTERAIEVLEHGQLSALFLKALQAAAARSEQLAEQFGAE